MKLSTYVFGIPAALLLGWLAIANRQAVTFSLDPFSQSDPAIAVQAPLYALIFVSVLIGMLIGWFVAAITQVRRRLAAKGAQNPPGAGANRLPEPASGSKTHPS